MRIKGIVRSYFFISVPVVVLGIIYYNSQSTACELIIDFDDYLSIRKFFDKRFDVIFLPIGIR